MHSLYINIYVYACTHSLSINIYVNAYRHSLCINIYMYMLTYILYISYICIYLHTYILSYIYVYTAIYCHSNRPLRTAKINCRNLGVVRLPLQDSPPPCIYAFAAFTAKSRPLSGI